MVRRTRGFMDNLDFAISIFCNYGSFDNWTPLESHWCIALGYAIVRCQCWPLFARAYIACQHCWRSQMSAETCCAKKGIHST